MPGSDRVLQFLERNKTPLLAGESRVHSPAGHEPARVALGHSRQPSFSRAGHHDACILPGPLQHPGCLLQPRLPQAGNHHPDLVHRLCCCGWSGAGVWHPAGLLLHPHGPEAGQAPASPAHAGSAQTGHPRLSPFIVNPDCHPSLSCLTVMSCCSCLTVSPHALSSPLAITPYCHPSLSILIVIPHCHVSLSTFVFILHCQLSQSCLVVTPRCRPSVSSLVCHGSKF